MFITCDDTSLNLFPMQHMNSLRRKFDGKISEGQWSQLLWVFFFIGLTFVLFLILSRVLFGPDSFGWQDIIALYLDPGVFNGAGQHDLFRLIVTLFGAFLFAAVLISIVSNIFSNISDSFRRGESRYKFKNHILILGGSHILFDILKGIEKDESNLYHNRQVVIMTTSQTNELRDEVSAFLNNKNFLKRITFYFDKRDNKENLKGAYADKADFIYVIGEDIEPDHDIINIRCCNLLHSIVKNENTECYVIMDSQTTLQLNFPELRGLRNDKMEPIYNTRPPQVAYNEIFLNINEVKAEFILSNTILKLFDFSKDSTVNVVIFGMTSFGRALAITIARTFHFCNNNKTIITIIDSGLKAKTDDFVSRNQLLFNKCNCEYVSEFAINEKKTSSPEAEVSWVFVDAAPSSETVCNYLDKIRQKNNTFSFVCFDDVSKNIATQLNLQNRFQWLKTFANFGDFENDLPSRLTGFAIDSSDSDKSFFSYIFNERQIKVREYYDCKENKISKFDWKDLYYGDRQLVTYKATASILKGRSNIIDDVFCFKGCAEFAQYMMGIGDEQNMELKGLKYDEIQHYVDELREYEKKCPLFINTLNSDYFEKLKDVKSEEHKEYVKYYNDLGKLFERIQNKYIYSLQQKNDECDIADYLYYLFLNGNDEYLNSTSFEKFMGSLLDYVDKKKLFSETTTFALLSYCKPNFVCAVDNECDEFIIDIPQELVNLSKKIIQQQAKNDDSSTGTYSYLAMSIISDEYEDMKFWYEKVINNNNQYCIPNSYYAQIGKENVERLYHDTKSEKILDWLIINQIPIINSKNFETDFISNAEDYTKKLTGLDDEDLYYRLGLTKGLNSCFQGMWLQKAERKAKENDSIAIQFKSSLQLAFYFNSRDIELATTYFKQARTLIQTSKDYILNNWNSFIIDDTQYIIENAQYIEIIKKDLSRLKKEFEREQKSGKEAASPKNICGNETGNILLEEDLMEAFKDEQYWQNEIRNEIENEISLIQEKISSWEESYPCIEHPYSKALSELEQRWENGL